MGYEGGGIFRHTGIGNLRSLLVAHACMHMKGTIRD